MEAEVDQGLPSGDEDERQALPFKKLTSKSLNYEAMKSTLMKRCIGERHKGMKFKERVVKISSP